MNINKTKFYKEFIQEEIDFYLREGGFNDRERTLFLIRVNDGTLEEASEKMNVSKSTIDRINRTMKKKIIKSSHMYYKGISKNWK